MLFYKWLWYINAAVLALIMLVLIIGLAWLGGYDSDAAEGREGGSAAVVNGTSADSAGSYGANNDSPLVAAVRLYSSRWEPPVGSLKITIEPAEAVVEGAQWRTGKIAWQKSDATVQKISVGTHNVTFKPLANWSPPKKLSVKITRRQATSQTAIYTRKAPPEYGSLTVIIEPKEAIKAGGQWQVAGGGWQASGVTVKKVLVGTQAITLKPLTEWVPSAKSTTNITKGQAATATVTYAKKPPPPPPEFGSLTVTITPAEAVKAGAQWRIKGNKEWQTSGAIINDTPVGSQLIEFKTIAKPWTTPKAITAKIKKEQNTTVSGKYAKPKPPAPKFVLTGTIMGYDGGLAWIKLPKETTTTPFFVGKTIDQYYTLTKVTDGAAVVTRDGYEFSLKVPKTVPQKTPAPPAATKSRPPPRRKIPPRPPVKKRE
ncbi:MAG: hypothetical protein KAJ46_02605 [Sedimentisphaerales bacterium]|nr:hypothetical protein [Sedimentisphaerales bacterium]